jgi:Protein of unknown function (DUF3592)
MGTIAGLSFLLGIAGAMCAMVVPVAVLGGIGIYVYRRRRMRDAVREAAQSWPSTMGVVVASTIRVTRTHRSRSETPVVAYQYQVDGQPYVGKVVKAGEQFFSARLHGDAQRTVDRYPVGAQVTVFYDPANPADSVLER